MVEQTANWPDHMGPLKHCQDAVYTRVLFISGLSGECEWGSHKTRTPALSDL